MNKWIMFVAVLVVCFVFNALAVFANNNVSTNKVVAAKTEYVKVKDIPLESSGLVGFYRKEKISLETVTQRQWEMTKRKVTKLYEVGDGGFPIKDFPKDSGPVLVSRHGKETYWVTFAGGTQGWLSDDIPKPEGFWVATNFGELAPNQNTGK